MKKDNMTTMLLVLGGLGVAYWYMTNYGPNGAAYNAAGQQVAATWWDTWFGGATAQAVSAASPTTVTQTPGGSTQPAPSTTADVRTKLLTATGGANSLNADQWDYYRNQLYPPALTTQQFASVFTRTDPMPTMTVDQFLSALQAGGINAANPGVGVQGIGRVGAIMQTATAPQVPSMSFGGSLAKTRLSPSRRPVVGGGFTIQ